MTLPTWKHPASWRTRSAGSAALILASVCGFSSARLPAASPQIASCRFLRGLGSSNDYIISGSVRSIDALLAIGESPRDKSLDPLELASWTMLASGVLNLDETLTRN